MGAVDPINETALRLDEFTVDVRRRGLYRGSERVHLTPKPFAVLVHLVQNRGRVVTKEELLEAVWGGLREGNTVEQAIRQIRLALGDAAEHPRFIQTIPGEGYSFIAAAADPVPAEVAPVLVGDMTPRSPSNAARSRYRRYVFIGVIVAGAIALGAAFRPGLPDPKLSSPTRITHSSRRILSPILTDGARLFYQEFADGRYYLAQVSASGGEAVGLPGELFNAELCDIKPDGSALLIRDLTHSRENNEPVYLQPIVGGKPRRIGQVMAYDVGWYSDGRQILYSSDGSIFRSDLEGRSVQKLFTVPGNAFWFRWSPDARSLRFTVIDTKTEATSLWEVSADGSKPRRLFPDLRLHQCCGSWTPDGAYFIFQVRVESNYQIWARREERAILRRVNHNPVPLTLGPMNYRGPVASRDGKKLFMRTEIPKGELVRYDSRSRQFITLFTSISPRTLAFSRDGVSIAYTSLVDNNLWRCRSDGGGCIQLTSNMQQTALPRWSPDGQVIAFMGRHFGGNWGIFTVPAAGGGVRSLSPENSSEGDPDWSPDGRSIVFGNVLQPSSKTALYIRELGSNRVSILPGSDSHFSPRWSPDGKFIVALRSDNQRLDIFELASGRWQDLTDVGGGYPNWSHDGMYVYYVSNSDGHRIIHRVNIYSRVRQEVATLANVERGPFIMGDWIGLAPDDAPLTVRNLSSEDIYSWDLILP
jgi:Tol biopolymer transport system component/DNA-binding winged helix-turn-helix (wHTH) protein